MPWARRATKPLPNVSSRTEVYDFSDYSLGFNTFFANDKLPNKNGGINYWRLAQDARILTLGEYGTRKGFDFHSDAAGETQDQAQTSTTGAADQSFNAINRLGQIFTAGTTGRLSKLEIRLKNDASASGTILVELWTNVSTAPGVLVSRSSIASSTLTSSYAYYTARFADAPSLTSGTSYWIVVYTQANALNSYKWSSTTSATTAKSSTNSGATWSATSFALNFRQYYATTGGVKGLHRAYKSDGTAVTLFAHGTVLYSVNEVTGALTSVKTGLSASATHYRFVTVNDIVYYVNGFDGLRKLSGASFATESQVNATNYTHIALHKGLLFLVEKNDPNKVPYSNFADYETFTSTDFVYVPAPKTGDPTTALQSLNGYLLIFTKDNKYILSGDDNATFTLEEAPDQKGSYTQETTTIDKNFVYYLGNDGLYRSNGSEAQLVSKNNYQDVLGIQNRDRCVLCVNKGRLYLWFSSAGSAVNDQCYVWNLNYSEDTLESFDTNAYVGRALTAFNNDNQLLVASSNIGQVYWQELASNDYTNLGGDINFLLQTHYNPYSAASVLKEIRYWKPRVESQSADYDIDCEYATDLRDNWQVVSNGMLDVQGAGETYGSGVEYGDGSVYGTTAETQGDLYVPGEYRRIALRYKHYATRQPHTFLGHTQVVQTRRLR